MTLTYRAEYADALGRETLPPVLLVQEWLGRHLDALLTAAQESEYLLLPHCTEQTTALASLHGWEAVFARCGLRLRILASGCCGMAGTYGHETEHRATSERIYGMSWADHVDGNDKARLLATGYSCRSQVKLIDAVRLQHPVQALLGSVRAPKAA